MRGKDGTDQKENPRLLWWVRGDLPPRCAALATQRETPPPRARAAHATKTKTMAARKLVVLAASLLECHSASALAMPFIGARLPPPALVARSIGAQLASVDPAVWAAGTGVAATIRLQREAVVRIRIDEIRAGGNETGRLGLELEGPGCGPR